MKVLVIISLFLLALSTASAQEPTPTPPTISEEVTVTAARTETRIADTPASMTIFSRTDIETSAAPTIDDILRQSVGFSIFRRSSSRNANPTTQGVSLRGVGASGASRTVVLSDGVPLNDPFGGWVQWNRVPTIGVETVEVLRGGASSLYGDTSLSGAVNVIPRAVQERWIVSADVFGGTQKTISGSVFAGFKADDWLGDISLSNYQTRGYKPIDEDVRGPADVYAGVRSFNFAAKLSRQFGKQATVFIKPSYFGEVRTNGTGLQTNRTHIRQIVAGGDVRRAGHNVEFAWRAFGGTQVYDQVFSAVNSDRTAESLTRLQRVPAEYHGGSAQVSTVFGEHTIVAGAEARKVRGVSNEIGVANNIRTVLVDSGGRERFLGVFGRDFVQVSDRVVITGGIRYDRWHNYHGSTLSQSLISGQSTAVGFPDRAESAVSPQLSVLVHFNEAVSVYGNASRSFRSPTLNELYRGFRVGSVLTLANENLTAERADNVEGGVRFGYKSTSVKTAVFWTRINRTISNVTLMSTPNLITRQRQNAGQTRAQGIEVEAETRWKRLRLNGGYLFADSEVTEFASNPALEGLSIPQVPRHQFTAQANYVHGRWALSAQGRGSSDQFDDDQNQFVLEPYGVIDIFISRRLKETLQVYAGIENLLNTRYSIGRTPVRSVSAPIAVRLGFRWN